MGYIENSLMTGEKVLYRTYLHWFVFSGAIFWGILALFLFIVKFETGGHISLVFFFIAFISEIIRFKTSEFGLTDKRVLVKVGFIKRNSVEILLTKVEGIQVDQSIFGRVFGYGTIIISGTGGLKSPFHKIASPLKFRKEIQEQISKI
ncbi:PH domain-containing protein [bacterium]|nr:PH domain-containing protein [bacterium]